MQARRFVLRAALLGLVWALSPVAACQCDDALQAVPGAVAGRVCDPGSGAGVPGEVRLEGGGAFQVTEAGPDGRFAFPAAAAGEGTIVPPASSATDDRRIPVLVVAGELVEVEDSACRGLPAPPRTGAVEGQICDRHIGALVTSAAVVIAGADGATITTATDSEGRFHLLGVAEGDHVVTVQAPGYARSFSVTVVAGGTALLDVGGGCRPASLAEGMIEGALCDAAGGPLVGARVEATDPLQSHIVDVTDVGGEFFLAPLAPGDVVVRVTRGSDVDVTAVIAVSAGGTALVCGAGEGEGEGEPPIDVGEGEGEPPIDVGEGEGEGEGEGCVDVEDPSTPGDDDCDGAINECDAVEVDIFLIGDCLTSSCPAEAPYPVGCNVLFSPGDDRGCVAHTAGSSSVYFQAGDQCNAGLVTGTLLCSPFPCETDGAPVVLDESNCPINKPVPIYADDVAGCPETDD